MIAILRSLLFIGLGLIPATGLADTPLGLTLSQVEQVAVARAPELKALRATSRALGETAVAVGQLPDPKLMLGAMNVPVDTFALSREPMTQVQVGVIQAFPKGKSRCYRSLQQDNLSRAAAEKGQATEAQILQAVRIQWIDLYYWVRGKRIIEAQKRVFRHLVNVTESMLATNKAQQKDVLRAQLELAALDNQLLEFDQHLAVTRAQLARWIGASLAQRANPTALPQWHTPPPLARFTERIKHHPTLRTDQAQVAASQAGVKLALQDYAPGFSVGLAYGFRQGRDRDGGRRADFLTAQLQVDLPFFTANRQDRRLKASEASLLAKEEDQISHYRQLRALLNTQYATWQQQRKSAMLYRQRLVPDAKQYAQATMTAYQNAQSDFPTLARAYIRELTTQLTALKARRNQAVARANLLYLEG